jgi:hypothetical protein
MFKVILDGNIPTQPLFVEIEGCPYDGLPAIDFRRRAGLPEEPTNKVALGPYTFTDEAYCRGLAHLLNDKADLEVRRLKLHGWHCNAVGEVSENYNPFAMPRVRGPHLAQFLAAEDAAEEEAAARVLVDDIIEAPLRSKSNALDESARIREETAERERQKLQAREVLKKELEELEGRAGRLEAKVLELMERLNARTAELDETQEELDKLRASLASA